MVVPDLVAMIPRVVVGSRGAVRRRTAAGSVESSTAAVARWPIGEDRGQDLGRERAAAHAAHDDIRGATRGGLRRTLPAPRSHPRTRSARPASRGGSRWSRRPPGRWSRAWCRVRPAGSPSARHGPLDGRVATCRRSSGARSAMPAVLARRAHRRPPPVLRAPRVPRARRAPRRRPKIADHDLAGHRRHVLGGEAERGDQLAGGRRGAEPVDGDDGALRADPAVPAERDAGLDAHAPRGSVGGRTSSRYALGCASKRSQQGSDTTRVRMPSAVSSSRAVDRERQLRPGRDEDDVGRPSGGRPRRPRPRARSRPARRRRAPAPRCPAGPAASGA